MAGTDLARTVSLVTGASDGTGAMTAETPVTWGFTAT